LDQQVFCYFGWPEQIHSNQGAQFQSQLMSDLCKTWGVNQSRTTLYHPQGNGVVERNNRMLGDSLRSLLIGKSQEEWDLVLPQIMRAYRSTPHSSTLGTPNFLMLGRETRVPEHITYHVPAPESNVHMRRRCCQIRREWPTRRLTCHCRRRRLAHWKTGLGRPHPQWSWPKHLSPLMRWKLLKFTRKRQLGGNHMYRWNPCTGDTTRSGRVTSGISPPSTVGAYSTY